MNTFWDEARRYKSEKKPEPKAETVEFRDIPMHHFFTAGWPVYRKLSDRTGVQVSGWLDGQGTIENFPPDTKVVLWGTHPPSEKQRLDEFNSRAGIAFTLLHGYTANLTRIPEELKPLTEAEQQTLGNFFIQEKEHPGT